MSFYEEAPDIADVIADASNWEPSDSTSEIEEMVLSFLRQLANGGRANHQGVSDESDDQPVKPAKPKIQIQLTDRTKDYVDGQPQMKTVTFPRKTKGASSQGMARLFRVLDLVHECLVVDLPMTKRDLYYKDPELFGAQRTVDTMVDDLAATFSMERADLNIRATSKGLVCGSKLVLHLVSGERILCNDSEGALIPVGENILSIHLGIGVAWILVIEKDAVFQTLCHHKLCSLPGLPGPGLMFTGKGYPDIATRQLVKTVVEKLPNIPVLALVDGDPYGLDILSVYKFGSRALHHEAEKLACNSVEWLGIFTSELDQCGISRNDLIPITSHDEKKAIAMLKRGRDIMPREWRKELMQMLHTRRKAEIEIFSSIARSSEAEENTAPMDYPFPSECQNPSSLLAYVVRKISLVVESTKPNEIQE